MIQSKYDRTQLEDLVLQMMETELGGEKIYRTALESAIHEDLHKEWEGYLQETLHHQQVVRGLCATLGLAPNQTTPTRAVVGHIGKALVQAIELPTPSRTKRYPSPPAMSLMPSMTLMPPATPGPRRRKWLPPSASCWPKPRTTPTGSCWAGWPR